MSDTSLFYKNEKLGKTQVRVLHLPFKITAAKTVAQVPLGQPVLTTFDAIAAQATIDDFLGTSSEFTIAQFDATAMGADTFGGVVNMLGQVKAVSMMEAVCYSASGATSVLRGCQGVGLTASTLETAYALGAYGNLAFKVDFGNTPDFDGLTAGQIIIKLQWIAL